MVAECEKFGSAKHFTLNLIETVLLLLDMVPLKCESWVDKPIHVGNYKQTFAAEYSFWCQPLQRERVFLLRHRLIFTLHKQQKSCGCHMNHITTYELAILRGD